MKKLYISPITEVVETCVECQLPGETKVTTDGGATKQSIVSVSHLDDGEFWTAKHHNLWDDDSQAGSGLWDD